MLPVKVKLFAARVFSAILAIGLFILLLPITIGVTVGVMFVGLVTLATLRYRLGKKSMDAAGLNSHTTRDQTAENLHKPPIEGSYKVVE